MQKHSHNAGYIYAIVSAILFGSSTPFAKYLLSEINPWLLAGLLYFGSGVGLAIILLIQHFWQRTFSQESNRVSLDYAWLMAATLFGGIIGPVLLMWGLHKTQASTASLLLNLENVFTALIAWIIFKEHTNKKLILGMLFIVVGSLVLTWHGHIGISSTIGAFLIAGACASWAIDNNITRKISIANPIKIVAIKSFIAGSTNIILALVFSTIIINNYKIILASTVIGFIGYGISIVFFILGLRHIGTGRTSAYFSMAPFVGAGLSVLFLGENFSIQLVVAALLMGCGILLHLMEQHSHEHEHKLLMHTHKHYHDDHHQHEHLPTEPKGEPHSHRHTHLPLWHSHPHYPDIHHRHKH